MIVSSLGASEVSEWDSCHISTHKSAQRLKHTVAHGYYVSSAYTGYRWKGDYIKMFFETIVYRFRNDDISLERIILPPIITYDYKSYEECIKEHNLIVHDIYMDRFPINEYTEKMSG